MIVADTNVVSEFMRERIAPQVLDWAAGVPAGDLTITAITVQEIEYGIGLLPDGRRRAGLHGAWAGILDAFADVLIDYDLAAARSAAEVLVSAQHAERPMSLADAQIAGCCLAHGAVLATRNVRDFAAVSGLRLHDPWGPSAR